MKLNLCAKKCSNLPCQLLNFKKKLIDSFKSFLSSLPRGRRGEI